MGLRWREAGAARRIAVRVIRGRAIAAGRSSISRGWNRCARVSVQKAATFECALRIRLAGANWRALFAAAHQARNLIYIHQAVMPARRRN